MELKYLYTIKKIIETGSYQKAASALNYAQSTITFQVQQIEKELSIKIFERTRTGMEVTQEGKEILPLIDKIISATEELASIKDNRDELRGNLKIALPESLITYKMQPVLKEFKEKAPNVKLSIQVLNCYSIYEKMIEGMIDIAIHYDVKKYSCNIATEIIASYPLSLISSPLLSQTESDFTTSNQKKTVCHLQNDSNALYLKIFNEYLREKNIALETEMELWSIESIKQCVTSNLGVAFLPSFTVQNEIEQGLVKEIPIDSSFGTFTAIYAYNKRRWKSPAMELFLQILDKFKIMESSS